MDINEYINSGIVELYALNALTSQEKAEFEQKLMLYPELKTELLKVQEGLEVYLMSKATNPRPDVRTKILAAIEEVPKKKSSGKVLPIDGNNSLTYKYMVAAALAALVVSTFASWFFYSKWNDAENRYSALLNDKNQLAINYNMVKIEFDRTNSDLIVMRDAETNVVQLSAKDTSQSFEARVYWNKNTKQAYIDVLNLPAPAPGKQYQLWALVAGKPVDAGIFELNEGIQMVKDVLQADAWAVTIEPKGGSLVPSLDQLFLLGKNS